jgi:type II secretory pathway pseudopilin PulG
MKKSFTLLEVVISITIFMILLIFLYKVLDQTKLSNKQFKQKSENLISTNNLYNIILEDISESYSKITLLKNDKNTIIKFESNNTYHNSFFNHITYLISSSNKLVRIESKDIFNQSNTGIEFYDDAFIDILLDDIEYFEVIKTSDIKNKYYAFAIKQKDKNKVLFNTYRFHPEAIKVKEEQEKKDKEEIK